MAESDLVVIWGTNPVNTQINVMTHATKARKQRGARIAVVDVYETGTAKQADIFVRVNPGTDAALACAVMHVLFRDGYANRDYLARYADAPEELEAHLKTRDPAWASRITGASVETPSLRFVAGTGPYFHDGRYATLSQLLRETKGTMGWAADMPADDLAALEAYLLTL